MRVLFVTAYYPPCDYGWGYMRLCESVADYLFDAGHDVRILTSFYRHGEEQKAYPVHRLLSIDPDWRLPRPAMLQFFLDHPKRERQAVEHLRGLVADFKPQVVFAWHGNELPRRLFQAAESLDSVKVAYYLANYMPEIPDEYDLYWRQPGKRGMARLVKQLAAVPALRMMKRAGKPITLAFPNTIHVSEYVRSRLTGQGLVGPNAVVIPTGVSLEALKGIEKRASKNAAVRLVYAGRVSPEKGVHTLVEACRLLRAKSGLPPFSLTIIGDGPPDYMDRVRKGISAGGLESLVRHLEPVALEAYREILAGHDILVFPSIWDEPLSNTMMEAMALGLLVIGTDAGGSGEILRSGETGLVFSPGDASVLAEHLEAAIRNPDSRTGMAEAGKALVRSQYNLLDTFRRIEAYLSTLAAGDAP